MTLQVMSDLHLEHAPFYPEQSDADIVVLAGDIATGSDGVLWARDMFQCSVIYVCGNHEYHDPCLSISEHMAAMKKAAEGSNVMLLDNDMIEIGGVRFLGSTLWTDLSDFGSTLYCDRDNIVVDHDADNAPIHFSVEHQQALFERNSDWLETELGKPFEGKTVVVTHHAPSLRSLHPQYAGNDWNPCFMSNLEDLMPGVDLWLHGHTHSSFDHQIGTTRVVCNPRGYPSELGGWENREFNPSKVISI